MPDYITIRGIVAPWLHALTVIVPVYLSVEQLDVENACAYET